MRIMADDGPEDGGDADLAALLGRIRAGDESAARGCWSDTEAQVRLVVRRQLPRLLRSRFDSLDFLQSVWGSFFRRMKAGPDEFEDPRSLVAFLARAAKNKVIDEYRRAASKKGNMRREEPLWIEGSRPRELVGDDDSPSEIVEAREAFGRLLDLLPEDRQVMLELRVEGLSTREIGERLAVSERTVRRVLEDLRRRSGVGGGRSGPDPSPEVPPRWRMVVRQIPDSEKFRDDDLRSEISIPDAEIGPPLSEIRT